MNLENESSIQMEGFYPSLDDFFAAELSPGEEIFSAVCRGDVGCIAAVTNYGKTTLLFNLGLSLAAGVMCLPLAPVASTPRRVLYIDAESPAYQLREDLKIMLEQIPNADTACQNFCLVTQPELDDEPLDMKEPAHFNFIARCAKGYGADLIVFDPITLCFELDNENDNSEWARAVAKPLKRLAKKCNAAVVFSHHLGKGNESHTTEAAYKSRGASAIGALSRTVYLIEKEAQRGEGYVRLWCPKSKTPSIAPTILRLNRETRFFEACPERPVIVKTVTAEEIAAFVATCETGASSGEIVKFFAGRESERSINDKIQLAESSGLIAKPSRKARWMASNATINKAA